MAARKAKKTARTKVPAKKAVRKKAAAKKPVRTKAPAKKPVRKKAPAKKPVRRGRWKETVAQRKERAAEILRRLEREYPDARTALDFEGPYQLLVATILSAQCTDERVNMVTPALFRRFPAATALAGAKAETVEDMIRSTGFFRNKTRSLLGMSNAVVDRHAGEIPDTMEELVELPGVGRKTANVVLGNAFGKDEGIVVDTHVGRLSRRLGLTRQDDPVRVEKDLTRLFPRDTWTDLAHVLIFHGRAICRAPRPRCGDCVLADICPSSTV
jgi:endonuclease-3